jgi:DNA invertase Pin-like site-specific DNA recombinase
VGRPGSPTASALFHLTANLFRTEASLPQDAVPEEEIRRLYAEKVPMAEIARLTGVTRWVVRRVLGMKKASGRSAG